MLLGLFRVSIGLYAGVELSGRVSQFGLPAIQREGAFLPIVSNCNNCHHGEATLSLVAKDPFLEWRSLFFSDKPKQKKLSMKANFPLWKYCFLDSPLPCAGSPSQCHANGLPGICGVSSEECNAGQGSLQASVDCRANTKCCVWDPVTVERPEIPGEIIIDCRDGKRIFKVNINVIGRGGAGGTRSVPIEMVFSLDSSGSMSGDKIVRSKAASIEIIEKNLNAKLDFAGVVSWNTGIDISAPLTNDFDKVKTKINEVGAYGGTDPDLGIKASIGILQASALPAARRAILLLTDGEPSTGKTYTKCSDYGSPAKDAANKGYKIYSVGLGSDAAVIPLQDMAKCTNGLYIPSASAADLSAVFTDLFDEVLDSTSPLDVTASFTLMPGITYVPSSTNPLATRISTTMDGRTELVWEKIDGSKGLPAGDNYPISFEVTASSSGQVMDRLISGITFRDPEGRTGKVLPPLLFIDLEASDPCNSLI